MSPDPATIEKIKSLPCGAERHTLIKSSVYTFKKFTTYVGPLEELILANCNVCMSTLAIESGLCADLPSLQDR